MDNNKGGTIIMMSIGSNIEQEKNIKLARTLLTEEFQNIKYTSLLWTAPIDITSDYFLNCLAIAKTQLNVDDIINIIKKIENRIDSTHEEHKKGIVKIDIDLLMYGETHYHDKDWERPYVYELMKELHPLHLNF